MFVVITGASHSGKSTLVEALRRAGEAVVPEAALAVIDELSAEHADPAAWRATHYAEFAARLARRQAEQERAARAAGGRVFLDRGLVDGLAYCRQRQVEPPRELLELVAAARYDRVFLLDLVLPFDARPGTGRTSDEAAARQVRELLRAAWTASGLPPVDVPLLPLEERLRFVLERCQS